MEYKDPTAKIYGYMMEWDRSTDLNPLPMQFGFFHRSDALHEVYRGDLESFNIDDGEAARIHDGLKLAQPNQSLTYYSMHMFKGLNHHLFENHFNGSSVPVEYIDHIKNIDSSLYQKTDISPLKLYTGVEKSPVTIAGTSWSLTRPNKLIHLPSYTSTTTNFDKSIGFASVDDTTQHHESIHHGIIEPNSKHVIELNFKHPIRDAVSMVKHSVHKDEEEILLGRGHQFVLHHRPTEITHPDFDGKVYVWKAQTDFRPVNRKKLY